MRTRQALTGPDGRAPGGGVAPRRLLAVALAWSVLLLALVFTAAAVVRGSGTQHWAGNAPWRVLLAVALWSGLASSVVLSVWGVLRRSWPLLALAAVLSGVFSGFAALSVGPFTAPLALLQAAGAVWLGASRSRPRWTVLLLPAAVVCAAAVGRRARRKLEVRVHG